VNKQSEIRRHLSVLAEEIGPRPAGSEGQRRAEQYIAGVLSECGFAVDVQRIECPGWHLTSVSLNAGSQPVEALANPFSPSCRVSAPLVCVQSLEELQQADLAGRIVVMAGDLTAAPFFPKNFDYFRDEAQDAVIQAVEQKAPLAVITVSHLDVPVPLIEDADFPLPSVTVARQAGEGLVSGAMLDLTIEAVRLPGFAANIVARGPAVAEKRLVVCAHYDTKHYTPGALDNAAGVAALLTLARRLAAEGTTAGMELVAFGGEDSWYPYTADYSTRNGAHFPTIAAAINIDGIGLKGSGDTVTFLACPEVLVESVLAAKERYPAISRIDPWYSGDHSQFWPKGIPSLALTSAGGFGPYFQVIHTAGDTVENVDTERIEETLQFVHDVVRLLK